MGSTDLPALPDGFLLRLRELKDEARDLGHGRIATALEFAEQLARSAEHERRDGAAGRGWPDRHKLRSR